jgi:hypothetical protein
MDAIVNQFLSEIDSMGGVTVLILKAGASLLIPFILLKVIRRSASGRW